MAFILHIADRAAWEAAQLAGTYSHASLETEGFIHCSTPDQIVWVANTFMAGQTGLVLLGIESDRLTSELRYDAVEGVGQFPHVYGPINLDAVVQVVPFEPKDGKFDLADDLPEAIED